MDIGTRIKLVRGGQTRESFARRLGIHPQTLYRYESGGRSVDAELIMKICQECSTSSEWLIFGTGPMYTDTAIQPVGEGAGILMAGEPIATFLPQENPIFDRHAAGPPPSAFPQTRSGQSPETVSGENAAQSVRQGKSRGGNGESRGWTYAAQYTEGEILMVPMVDAHLSAGHGSFEVSGDVTRHYAFRADFLMRKGQVAHMVLMRVDGDSMAPQIQNNDVVLLDQSQKDLRPGKIYAVGVEDMVYLKKVDAKPGEITLYSINEEYSPLRIDTRGDQEDCIRIIGRAVWWCRED